MACRSPTRSTRCCSPSMLWAALRLPALPPEPTADGRGPAGRPGQRRRRVPLPGHHAGAAAVLRDGPRSRWSSPCPGRSSRRSRTSGSAAAAAVGWLYSAIAIGSMIGGLTSGWIGRVRRQGLGLVRRGGRLGPGGRRGRAGPPALADGRCCSPWPAPPTWSARCCRQSMLQVYAPDRMRGRLQGVNTVVVAGGPRLGDLRAGAMAAGFGGDGGLGRRRARLGGARGGARGRVPGAAALPGRDGVERRPGADRLGSPAWKAPIRAPFSGAQWTISAAGHEAVIVEVGGGLRTYRHDGVDLLDGYADRRGLPRLRRAGAGALAEPDPRRSLHVRRAGAPARADRAGAAQRHPRPGQLGAVAAAGAVGGRRDARLRPAAAARLPVAAAAAQPVERRRGRAARRARGDQHRRRGRRRSASPCTRTCSCRASRWTTWCCGCRPGAGCWWTAGCCRSARPRWPAPSTTGPSPRRIGAAVLDSAFGDVIRDADGGSSVSLAAPDGSAGVRIWADARVRLVAGVHRRHAHRRAAPPLGGDRADDLPAGRVPVRPGPDHARARARPGGVPGASAPAA